MTDTAAAIAYPEWTETQKKNGLDPLGMQTSSVSLYQTFLPGISNVTLRVRYYGLYAWLCRTYAKSIGDTNPKSWQRIVRRSEALYALIGQKAGDETGMAGTQWAERTLKDSGPDPIDFASAAEPGSETYYLKQAWGVYGLAYASQLFETGVFAVAQGHDIPVPGPEIGAPLAAAFADHLGATAKQFFDIVQRGSVTLSELDALAPMLPSRISPDSAERQQYEDILFAKAGLERQADLDRRRTLLLILSLASRIEHLPKAAEVRWMLYKGRDLKGQSLSLPSDDLTRQRLRWRLYQANDLTHIAYETLLKYAVDLLEPYRSGITLQNLIGEEISSIRASVAEWPSDWNSFVEQTVTDDPDLEEALCNACIADARSDRVASAGGAWDALKLLAVVYARARSYEELIKSELGTLDPSLFRSLLSESRFLEEHAEAEFGELLHKLIEQRIIRRHLWVALKKLRHQGDYTFLIESDDGRVRLRVKDGPVFTNPRLGPAITFLKDIHLIDDNGLTDQGRKVLGSA